MDSDIKKLKRIFDKNDNSFPRELEEEWSYFDMNEPIGVREITKDLKNKECFLKFGWRQYIRYKGSDEDEEARFMGTISCSGIKEFKEAKSHSSEWILRIKKLPFSNDKVIEIDNKVTGKVFIRCQKVYPTNLEIKIKNKKGEYESYKNDFSTVRLINELIGEVELAFKNSVREVFSNNQIIGLLTLNYILTHRVLRDLSLNHLKRSFEEDEKGKTLNFETFEERKFMLLAIDMAENPQFNSLHKIWYAIGGSKVQIQRDAFQMKSYKYPNICQGVVIKMPTPKNVTEALWIGAGNNFFYTLELTQDKGYALCAWFYNVNQEPEHLYIEDKLKGTFEDFCNAIKKFHSSKPLEKGSNEVIENEELKKKMKNWLQLKKRLNKI